MHKKMFIDVTEKMTSTTGSEMEKNFHPQSSEAKEARVGRQNKKKIKMPNRPRQPSESLVQNRVKLRHKGHKRETRHLKGVTKGEEVRAQLVVFVLRLVTLRQKCAQISTRSVKLTVYCRQLSTKTDTSWGRRFQWCQESQI